MAANFITINRADSAATHATRILATSRMARELRVELENIIAESFEMFDGVGAEQFNLPKIKYGVASNAEAQTLFDILNGALAEVDVKLRELAKRIG